MRRHPCRARSFGGAEASVAPAVDRGPRMCHKGAMNADEFLRCRVPAGVRNRFDALARERGATSSSLLRSLIDNALSAAGGAATFGGAEPQTASARSERLTVRLRPGDGQRFRARAAARGAKSATYLAILVRAHLSADPPLPETELIELKRVLSELAAVARALRSHGGSGNDPGGIDRQELWSALDRVEQTRRATAEFVKASIASWESDLA